MGAPSNRRRAGRYQVALATLRERHREEFDLILLDLRAGQQPGGAVASGAVTGHNRPPETPTADVPAIG